MLTVITFEMIKLMFFLEFDSGHSEAGVKRGEVLQGVLRQDEGGRGRDQVPFLHVHRGSVQLTQSETDSQKWDHRRGHQTQKR